MMFTGKELFEYWSNKIWHYPNQVAMWESLKPETQDRWNQFAAMINHRKENENA